MINNDQLPYHPDRSKGPKGQFERRISCKGAEMQFVIVHY